MGVDSVLGIMVMASTITTAVVLKLATFGESSITIIINHQ